MHHFADARGQPPCFHVAIGLEPIMNDRETILRLWRA
jgi:hypothetical protein